MVLAGELRESIVILGSDPTVDQLAVCLDIILSDTGWEFGESFVTVQSFHFVILTLDDSIFGSSHHGTKKPTPYEEDG